MLGNQTQPPASTTAAERTTQKLEPEQLEELKEAFNLFDSEGKGTIDGKEFKAILLALGFERVTKEEVHRMILEATGNERSSLTFKQFVDLMSSKMVRCITFVAGLERALGLLQGHM